MKARTEATEAHVAELAEALHKFAVEPEYDCPGDMPEQVGWHCMICNATWQAEEDEEVAHENGCLLTATPEKALERAKALKDCEDIVREFKRRVEAGEIRSRQTYAQCVDAVDKLDALGKEAS